MIDETSPGSMNALLDAILEDDRPKVRALLETYPGLATRSIHEARLYQSKISHWIYVGDTALHLAAAGYRVEIVRLLLVIGANPNSAMNHRASRPLHYAADGYLKGPAWNPKRQVSTIECLIAAGAEINAPDKNGATPLHRAVRTRSVEAVKCLLENGSNAMLKNKPGSTPFHLAVQNTGHGGTGADIAKAAQQLIIQTFLSIGLRPTLKDGNGKTVLESARSLWIRNLLARK